MLGGLRAEVRLVVAGLIGDGQQTQAPLLDHLRQAGVARVDPLNVGCALFKFFYVGLEWLR